MPHNYAQKITELLQRINKKAKKKTIPPELQDLIEFSELQEIYTYINENSGLLKNNYFLTQGKPFRLDKNRSKLARTLNFVYGSQAGNIALILETKRKKREKKDLNIRTFSGKNKTTKPAWRIDSKKPHKLANAVFYMDDYFDTTEQWLSAVEKEINAAQSIVIKNQGIDTYIHSPALGSVIDKKGTRLESSDAHSKEKGEDYSKKISFYSPWAKWGNLTNFLKTKQGKSLNPEQLINMATQLLVAVKFMHEDGIIHQDLKPDNILVFCDSKGNYRLEVADFGLMCDAKKDDVSRQEAEATLCYESPEISAAKNNKSAHNYAYYGNENFKSYARDLVALQSKNVLPEEYIRPHQANDVWALGIILHELFYHKRPSIEIQDEMALFIGMLLNPNRDKRPTAEQAFELWKNHVLDKRQQKNDQNIALPKKCYSPKFNSNNKTWPDKNKPSALCALKSSLKI